MRSYCASVFDRYALRDVMHQTFARFDLLLTPTLPAAAFPVGLNTPPGFGDRSVFSWGARTYPFHLLAGQPAASIPIGLTAGGSPTGLQTAGGVNAEVSIFALAGALSEADLFPSETPAVSM